ncbi:protein FAM111A-like [Anguilla anguilla]|uniref:protein FAM111A-like n=1 Tax=Anguilla anguilla TaxID=7936 RepID=UPI0015B08937|nr:protein FAM111A-like [Anguilla anguilla]
MASEVKKENDESQQAENLATGGDREETEEKSAKQAEDLATGGDREETEEKSAKQAEDLATGGDREETKEKSAKDRKKHKSSHTFHFCEYGKAAVNTIPCTEAGTVLEALNKSEIFTSLVGNNEEKDIVIVRKLPEYADIATHFPCWLIKKDEELTIQFSSGNNSDNSEFPETGIITEESKLVTFYVDRKGGKFCKTKDFLNNMSNTDISYLCIYACVGETAEKALRTDGRFAKMVFQGGSELMNIKGRDLLEIHLPVTEEQDGKTFRLNMRKEENKSPQPTTEPDSGSQIAEQEAGPAQEQGESTSGSFHEIPEKLLEILCSQFEDLVKHMKEREKVEGSEKVLELLRKEFQENTKVFGDVYGEKNLGKSTYYYHETSGSPVFDADGQLVAMHTGGYSYKLGDTKCVIEFAIPLQHILEHFLKTTKKLRPDIHQSFIEVAEKQEALHPLIAPYTQPDPDSPAPKETSAPPP